MYTSIDDEQVIQQLSTNGVNDFVYNIGTIKNTKVVDVLSYVQGKSSKLPKEIYRKTKSFNAYITSKVSEWKAFDA